MNARHKLSFFLIDFFYLYISTLLYVTPGSFVPPSQPPAVSDPLQLPAHVQGGVHAQAALPRSGLLVQPRRTGDAGSSSPRRRTPPALLHPAGPARPKAAPQQRSGTGPTCRSYVLQTPLASSSETSSATLTFRPCSLAAAGKPPGQEPPQQQPVGPQRPAQHLLGPQLHRLHVRLLPLRLPSLRRRQAEVRRHGPAPRRWATR